MKTSGMEVLCDGCKRVIPVLHPTAIFATLKGPTIRHKKLDCCDVDCLARWADAHHNDGSAAFGGLYDPASHTPTPEPPQ